RTPTDDGWTGASITSGSRAPSRLSTAVFALTDPAGKTRHCGPPTISASGPTSNSAVSVLIQINVLWGTAMDRQVSTERILAAADRLRQLFLDSGYPPRRTKT